jgi:hypothetical protein
MSDVKRIQHDLERLEYSTPYDERDSEYYSEKSLLQARLNSAERREEKKRHEEMEEENTRIAAIAANHRKRLKESAEIAFSIIGSEDSINPESLVNALLYEKCRLVVAKALLLDDIIAKICSFLGANDVNEQKKESALSFASFGGRELEDKYMSIITSKGKTANVEI